MGKTIIPNKLNHKPQAHARVCEENEENKENDCQLKYFAVKRSNLEAYRTVKLPIEANFTTKILHSIKVRSSNNVCTRLVLAVVTETST